MLWRQRRRGRCKAYTHGVAKSLRKCPAAPNARQIEPTAPLPQTAASAVFSRRHASRIRCQRRLPARCRSSLLALPSFGRMHAAAPCMQWSEKAQPFALTAVSPHAPPVLRSSLALGITANRARHWQTAPWPEGKYCSSASGRTPAAQPLAQSAITALFSALTLKKALPFFARQICL